MMLNVEMSLTEDQIVEVAQRAAHYESDPVQMDWWWALVIEAHFRKGQPLPVALDIADDVLIDTPFPPMDDEPEVLRDPSA